MRADAGGRGLLSGLVAREVAMRRAVVDVTTVAGRRGDNSVAAGNGIMDTQDHWHPPQRISDALLRLTARLGTLRCGRIERRAASKALGRIVRYGVGRICRLEGLLHGSEVAHAVIAQLIVRRVGPAGDGLGGDDLRRTG
eukprot:scaffold50183_cov70-Phaeocystis_antarctica.AAC.3